MQRRLVHLSQDLLSIESKDMTGRLRACITLAACWFLCRFNLPPQSYQQVRGLHETNVLAQPPTKRGNQTVLPGRSMLHPQLPARRTTSHRIPAVSERQDPKRADLYGCVERQTGITTPHERLVLAALSAGCLARPLRPTVRFKYGFTRWGVGRSVLVGCRSLLLPLR